MRYNDLTRAESVAVLREHGDRAEPDAGALLHDIADYLEGTADDMTRDADREIAMAYATAASRGPNHWRRGVWDALREARLTR